MKLLKEDIREGLHDFGLDRVKYSYDTNNKIN
jgi:hypothetical protein